MRLRRTVLEGCFDAAAGAVAGTVATLPMSAVMVVAQRAGLMGSQPPRRVTDEALQTVGADPPEQTRRALTVLSHLAFGAAAGVPFALAQRLLPREVPRTAVGAVYGLGVWASAYLGWVPALGILPPADQDRPGRPQSMVLAHLVFGSVLGAATRLLRPSATRLT